MKRRGFLGLFAATPLIPKALLDRFDKDTYVEIDGKVIQGTKPSEPISHTPAYVFTDDTDTGIYRSSANAMEFKCDRDV